MSRVIVLMKHFLVVAFACAACFPATVFGAVSTPATTSLLLLSGEAVDFSNTGSLSGQIKDTNGSDLSGVMVTVSGVEATQSNPDGYFTVPVVPAADRVVVTFSKEGYVSTTANVRIQERRTTTTDPVMARVGQVSSYTGSELTISHTGGDITIPENALVDSTGAPFTGTAEAAFTVFDPTNTAERNAFPGDFIGRTQGGDDIPILSYGFFDITVRDSEGNELQLADGQEATFSIPIPADLLNSTEPPPDTMPLWHFNEENGMWEEKGTVTRVGDNYEGSVPHFSVWNNDVGYIRSWVRGYVVCNGVPVQGAKVTFEGVSPRNCWDSGESSTLEDGSFGFVDRVPVDADSVVDYFVELGSGVNRFTSSPKVRITSSPRDQTLDLGNIELTNLGAPLELCGAGLVTFQLSWGENPRDLDSHLWTPSGAHIYFANKNEDGASLNTDDVTGFGPEVVTISTLNDGEYTYAVHWYSGSGTWATSGSVQPARGASVVMSIGGQATVLTAPNGGAPTRATPAGTAPNYWEIWKLTVQNGEVVNVNTVNRLTDDQLRSVLPVKDAAYLEQHQE